MENRIRSGIVAGAVAIAVVAVIAVTAGPTSALPPPRGRRRSD